MKHLIMGTAGHVDHGKTALIQALTGIDCDTHREEKERGITINLGFAHMRLPSGDTLGIVDVPGHRDFVHTMVGGASGIDFALLVVAADGGVMPQTREHLQIMDVLGIRTGLVALTRVDLTPDDLADIAEEETRELLAGTFLDACPIVRTSPVTGQGIEELHSAIAGISRRIETRPRGDLFRMFIDRIFSVSGFGTIAAGSVMGGAVREGDTLLLLPDVQKKLRVRRLERAGEEVDEVVAGDRASMNLIGLDRHDFSRGMLVSDRRLQSTLLLDVELRLFEHEQSFDIWTHAVLHIGTYEHGVRVHLLDRNSLSGSETGLAQIHLDVPCVAQHGDRFVLRSASSDITLGGGRVLDPAPLHHKRRPQKLLDALRQLADGGFPALAAAEVRKRPHAIDADAVARALNATPEDAAAALADALPADILSDDIDGKPWFMARALSGRFGERALAALAAFHAANPLVAEGRTEKQLAGLIGVDGDAVAGTVRMVVHALQADGAVRQAGHTWVLAGHDVRPDAAFQAEIDFIADRIADAGRQCPRVTDLQEAAAGRDIPEPRLQQILHYLLDRGDIHTADGIYVHSAVVDCCRTLLLDAFAACPDGVGVGDFRDLLGASRKLCLLLFALYDAEGLTRRAGDVRVLTSAARRQAGE
jgi:selenocysteine-specific elongation factor